jgi:hypothetical protein
MLKGCVLPMNKKAWAARFEKYAVVSGINEPKKSCHGVRKARAEITAYADCTESQMMAMFGWTDPKMSAHYIAQANGKARHEAWTRSWRSPFARRLLGVARANRAGTSRETE